MRVDEEGVNEEKEGYRYPLSTPPDVPSNFSAAVAPMVNELIERATKTVRGATFRMLCARERLFLPRSPCRAIAARMFALDYLCAWSDDATVIISRSYIQYTHAGFDSTRFGRRR